MWLKTIQINNFKGFEAESFRFDPSFNVAIGNNASGKSTLLHAVQVALGAYLRCVEDITASKTYRRQFKDGEAYVFWSEQEKGYVRKREATSIQAVAQFFDSAEDISWIRTLLKNNTTSHNRKDAGQLMDAVEDLLEDRYIAEGENLLDTVIPVVASFGTERTVAQLRKVKEKQARRTKLEKGFLAALSEKVDFDGVIEWIHNYDRELKLDKEFQGTKEALFRAIETAVPYIKHVSYNDYYHEFEAEVTVDHSTKGKTLHSNMSDGLKAMLNMVAEIAFRCVTLNGFKGENAVLESTGIVLIDELDMHLHPIWQKRVVADLKAAFPKIQFIVTTHSPFIVQSLKVEELINLDMITSINPMDYSLEIVSEEIMNVSGAFSNEEIAEENLSLDYFKLLEEASTSDDKESYKVKLEQFENSIMDSGLRAFLKTHRIAKNII